MDITIDDDIYNEVYLPYLEDDTRLQIFFGGSSSGKSKFVAQRCVKDLLAGERNYLITRKVDSTIAGSVFNEITKVIAEWGIEHLFTVIKSPATITCANNYQAVFKGLDEVAKLKSITPKKGVFTDVWAEEATELERGDIKQLNKRLRGFSKVKKRITLTFNPIFKDHWLYVEFFPGWDEAKTLLKNDKMLILKTTYKDNEFLSDDDIEELENETDKYYHDVYTLGNWGVLGGVIFKNWKVQDCSEIKRTCTDFDNGLDFGFSNDPAALARTHFDRKNNRLYFLEEVYQKGLTNDDLADVIIPIIGKEHVVCDSAEPKSILELCQRGVRAVGAIKGKDSVRFGIQWLQQLEIIIDIDCPNTAKEFGTYKWMEDKNGNVLPKPVDRNNHIIDAGRMGNEHNMNYWKEKKEEPKKAKDYDRIEAEDLAGWMAG